jgi:hypothetical protein
MPKNKKYSITSADSNEKQKGSRKSIPLLNKNREK